MITAAVIIVAYLVIACLTGLAAWYLILDADERGEANQAICTFIVFVALVCPVGLLMSVVFGLGRLLAWRQKRRGMRQADAALYDQLPPAARKALPPDFGERK